MKEGQRVREWDAQNDQHDTQPFLTQRLSGGVIRWWKGGKGKGRVGGVAVSEKGGRERRSVSSAWGEEVSKKDGWE